MGTRASYLRYATAVVSAVAAVAGCSSSDGTADAASCVAPSISASPTAVHVGDALTVSGRWFWADCNDVATGGEQPPANTPIATVRLVLQPHGGQPFDVGTAHPDATGSFTATVIIPTGVQLGAAVITDDPALGPPAYIAITG